MPIKSEFQSSTINLLRTKTLRFRAKLSKKKRNIKQNFPKCQYA